MNFTPTELFLAGILVTIVGFWVKSQIEAFGRRDNRLEDRADRSQGDTSALAARVEGLAATVAHIAQDQQAHAQQSAAIAELQATVARIDERTLAMQNQDGQRQQQTKQLAEILAYTFKAAIEELRRPAQLAAA